MEYALWITTYPLLRQMYQRSAEPTLTRRPTQAPQGLVVLRYWPLLEMYQVQSEFCPIVKIWLEAGEVVQSKVKQLPLLVRQQLVPQILMPKPQILVQLLQHVPPMFWMQFQALLVLQKRLLPAEEELAEEAAAEPGVNDIMAIVVIPLEVPIDALSEVLVSMAMLELGGALGLAEDVSVEPTEAVVGATKLGMASTVALNIVVSMVIAAIGGLI